MNGRSASGRGGSTIPVKPPAEFVGTNRHGERRSVLGKPGRALRVPHRRAEFVSVVGVVASRIQRGSHPRSRRKPARVIALRGIQPACEYRFHCIVCTLLGRGISSSRHRSFGFVHARTSGRRRTISMDGPTPEVARRVLCWVRGKSDRLPASSAKRWFSDHRVGYAITRVVTRIRRP